MAGGLSEYRGLIVAGSLLALFAILTAAIPTNLYAADSGRLIVPPDYFQIDELFYYTSTDLINMTGTLSGLGYPDGSFNWRELDDGSGDFGGWDIDFLYDYGESSTLDCAVRHMHSEWFGFSRADHNMDFLNSNGVDRGNSLNVDEMESDGSNGNVRYTCTCDHTRLTVQFAYNTSLYNSFTDAWNSEGLTAFFGMQFDDENTGYNAINLIAGILFFQLPSVHWTINSIIAVPVWIAIGYISVILILWAIEALPFT